MSGDVHCSVEVFIMSAKCTELCIMAHGWSFTFNYFPVWKRLLIYTKKCIEHVDYDTC